MSPRLPRSSIGDLVCTRFRLAGDLANIGANIASVVQRMKQPDDDALTKATWQAAVSAAHLVSDEVGFLSLQNLFEAMHDEKRGVAWAAT
jgi:hypothetical protein